MDETERFNALMRLAEFRNVRIANRRGHEWKVTIGLWALLAAGIVELPPISFPWRPIIWLVLFFVVVGHATLWVGSHWAVSREDNKIAFFFADAAWDIALPNAKPSRFQVTLTESCKECFLCEKRCWAQILTTTLFATGVGLKAAGWW